MRKCKTYLYIYMKIVKNRLPSLQQRYKGCSWFFTLIKLCMVTIHRGQVVLFYFHPSLLVLMVTQLLPVFQEYKIIFFLMNYMLYSSIAYSSFLLYNCEKVKDFLHSRLFLKNCPPVLLVTIITNKGNVGAYVFLKVKQCFI